MGATRWPALVMAQGSAGCVPDSVKADEVSARQECRAGYERLGGLTDAARPRRSPGTREGGRWPGSSARRTARRRLGEQRSAGPTRAPLRGGVGPGSCSSGGRAPGPAGGARWRRRGDGASGRCSAAWCSTVAVDSTRSPCCAGCAPRFLRPLQHRLLRWCPRRSKLLAGRSSFLHLPSRRPTTTPAPPPPPSRPPIARSGAHGMSCSNAPSTWTCKRVLDVAAT
jgi:hypothetical protein